MRWFRHPARCLVLGAVLLVAAGCSRGIVKGPQGQGDKGVGLKLPVLGLFDKKTYDADNFTPENLDVEQLNPVREDKREIATERDAFTRYWDDSDTR